MSDFFASLASRALGQGPVLRVPARSRYEPAPDFGLDMEIIEPPASPLAHAQPRQPSEADPLLEVQEAAPTHGRTLQSGLPSSDGRAPAFSIPGNSESVGLSPRHFVQQQVDEDPRTDNSEDAARTTPLDEKTTPNSWDDAPRSLKSAAVPTPSFSDTALVAPTANTHRADPVPRLAPFEGPNESARRDLNGMPGIGVLFAADQSFEAGAGAGPHLVSLEHARPGQAGSQGDIRLSPADVVSRGSPVSRASAEQRPISRGREEMASPTGSASQAPPSANRAGVSLSSEPAMAIRERAFDRPVKGPASAPSPPRVHIEIGRVEIRATPAARTAAPPASRAPSFSLDAYLEGLRGKSS